MYDELQRIGAMFCCTYERNENTKVEASNNCAKLQHVCRSDQQQKKQPTMQAKTATVA
jgi:hypothetical protein